VDYLFDVPLDAAVEITGFRHDGAGENPGAYRDVTNLKPINGNSLERLCDPPKWWQIVGSSDHAKALMVR
jgi:hypothetical protein